MTSTLYQQIQQLYDASSGLWEQVWGEHMHHGYYGPDGNLKKERRQAQIDLIEELLGWARVPTEQALSEPYRILDVGCGIGGSTLYLTEKFGSIAQNNLKSDGGVEPDFSRSGQPNQAGDRVTATGITLSPVQANRAKERAKIAGLESNVNFLVADALNMPFPDESFDLVWSLESGEHMPDKIKFLQECCRVLKPGGTLILATWCHRPLGETAGELTDAERRELAEIYRVYALPYVISLPEYEEIVRSLPLTSIRSADWSKAVAPFWDVVIDSAFTPSAIWGLLTSGWTTIQAALALGLMSRGYESGLIRFGLICAVK
ncbi:MAG: methyltransferase domain-containing protein [Microcoleus sp. PH2017_10_PVI_O_A]|uniref:methyltransferase domain-containing protein n=1 Tax=unclassified Microcoleus TaxID=2642155 RepID=UPI001DDD2D8C|nr:MULTISPECIES: methyltransferase domain-containing protein [unclassified Microcoleus]TAE77820.1 MAG: methyltransferase domain-containing protein [Oscillatoriales cyanobacterium]MCC3407552.1 methyltransferase domain-containing protein [Microcoleus sp. PH2017_10_PVI_O_A]MCC3461727.1 methyltransferase domain-containing protein [Microcoleus sp. PH2017_11_PCY_U_A]MCC3481498.1 methyltransferase domain-containing protein [Microcoleus sp. PH2017_12_PCY_D_A]MCC3529188.1 methyltransferase domain-conta